MMTKKDVLLCLLIVTVLFSSCYSENKTVSRIHGKRFDINIFKTRKLSKDLYNAVWGRQVKWLKEILATGVNPNFCIGECGWLDSNPLNVIANRIESTYSFYENSKPVPETLPSITVFQLLIDAGADVNERPYVWNIVHFYNNDIVDRVERLNRNSGKSLNREDINDQVRYFVSDVNRLLQCFLKAGADPDKLGHPYPYSAEAMHAKINDKQANEYFVKGTRAINEAIEKGILWESQVDLLLQYVKLDENSLIAAQESGDSAMVNKINELWLINPVVSTN